MSTPETSSSSLGAAARGVRAGSPLGAWLRGLVAGAWAIRSTPMEAGALAAVGLTGINRRAREAIDADPDAAVLGEEGPLWFRGPGGRRVPACEELEAALLHLVHAAHRVTRPNAPPDRRPPCEGTARIDTASRHYGEPLGPSWRNTPEPFIPREPRTFPTPRRSPASPRSADVARLPCRLHPAREAARYYPRPTHPSPEGAMAQAGYVDRMISLCRRPPQTPSPSCRHPRHRSADPPSIRGSAYARGGRDTPRADLPCVHPAS